MAVYTADQCPVPERRFTGSNRGCWFNAEYDRLVRVALTTLDETERATATVEGFRILTQEAPVIPKSYNLDNIAVRKGLVGPGQRWSPAAGDTWNVHEWYWQ